MIALSSISTVIYNFIRTLPIIGGYIKGLNYNKPLTIDQIDSLFGVLEKRIRNAKSTVWISGNDLAAVNSRSAAIEEALASGRQVKIMHADASLGDMLAEFDDRFESADHFRDQIKSTLSTWLRMAQRYPNLQIRSSQIMAPFGLFITDHASDPNQRFVKIEIYACKPLGLFQRIDSPIGRGTRMNVVFNGKNRWDDFYIKQFENLWDKASISNLDP